MPAVKLNALERIVASNVLPAHGSFLEMRSMKKARAALDFSDEEVERFIQKPDPKKPANEQLILFTPEGMASAKEIDLGEVAHELLKNTLKRLNDEKKLESQHLTLYAKMSGEQLDGAPASAPEAKKQ